MISPNMQGHRPLISRGSSTTFRSSMDVLDTAYCLTEEGKKEDDVEAMEKLRKDIEYTQDCASSLCTEKVSLDKQAVLSPLLKGEFFSREEGSDARKSAMESLKMGVKQLDPSNLPMLFAHISDAMGIGSVPVESLISLIDPDTKRAGLTLLLHHL
ncbi:hypothetical protein MLD38_020078 [Melastoma candidum]|uniref:Uncharacterized protein n=1 Tax=Melastoma candidum TaxID=119954 RepID=A0ACB9QFK2_9MYRT|nr:hypothetical protein MLD38_020078 [Melastoma candidum]